MKNLIEKKTNLIYGPMDANKTQGIVFDYVEEIIKKEENLIIVDAKEEYTSKFLKELENNNYDVKIFNLQNPVNSNNYHLLKLAHSYFKTKNYDEAINILKKTTMQLLVTDIKPQDNFWNDKASDLLTGLVLLLFKQEKNINKINLASLLILTNELISNQGNSRLGKYLDEAEVTDPIYMLASSIYYAPKETREGIYFILSTELQKYCIRPNQLSLISNYDQEVMKRSNKQAIIIIPSLEDKFINNLVVVILNQLFDYSKQRYLTKENIIIDNIDYFNKINFLEEAIEVGYDHLKVTIITKNLKRLEKKYSENLFDSVVDKFEVENSYINNKSIQLKEKEYLEKEGYHLKKDPILTYEVI